MSDLKLEAELAEVRAELARTRYQLEDVELQRAHMATTTLHYLDAWITYRERVNKITAALIIAADTLEAEGLIRSADAARDTIKRTG